MNNTLICKGSIEIWGFHEDQDRCKTEMIGNLLFAE